MKAPAPKAIRSARLTRVRRLWPRAVRRRLAGLLARGQSGQALVEEGLLLATLFGVLMVGFTWVFRRHPDLLDALNVYVRGFYFVLSLPVP